MIGTGSSGNCYLLENETECLMIECGIRWKKILEGLEFNTKKVTACLLTHEHIDHARAAKDILGAGIDLYSSYGTIKAIGMERHHRAHGVDNQPFRVGNFKVMTFDVKHDAADPVGFLIEHEECGLVLFLTDTYYVPYKFEGLHNILVEANFDRDIMDRRLFEGSGNGFVRGRVMESHMSIETCKDMLVANDLSQVNNIVLIHLSSTNSHERRFIEEVKDVTGKTVTAARAGLVIDFNKAPY